MARKISLELDRQKYVLYRTMHELNCCPSLAQSEQEANHGEDHSCALIDERQAYNNPVSVTVQQDDHIRKRTNINMTQLRSMTSPHSRGRILRP